MGAHCISWNDDLYARVKHIITPLAYPSIYTFTDSTNITNGQPISESITVTKTKYLIHP